MKTLWSITAPAMVPAVAAKRFAATYSDRPRKVVDLSGTFERCGYFGRFQFENGNRWYELTCDSFGTWSVSVEEEGA